MTRDDIKQHMADAGLKTPARGDFIFIHWDQIAMLIAHERADEREACANACEDEICNCCWDEQAGAVAEHLAATIRARKNT